MSTPAKVALTQAKCIEASLKAFDTLKACYPIGTVILFKWQRTQVINSRGRVTGYRSNSVVVQMFESKKKTHKDVNYLQILGVVK